MLRCLAPLKSFDILALYKFDYYYYYYYGCLYCGSDIVDCCQPCLVFTLFIIISRSQALPSQSGRYKLVTAWMGDCLQTGKLSRYITDTKVNWSTHPSISPG